MVLHTQLLSRNMVLKMIVFTCFMGLFSSVHSQIVFPIPDLDQFLNITDQLGELSVQLSNISETCAKQVEVLAQNTDIITKMVDASAKFPYSGMLYSGRVELGNFDECMSIEHTYEGGRILGKYCLSGLFMPDFDNLYNIELGHQLATCTPDGCSAKDLVEIGKVMYPNVPLLFIDNFCTTIETGQEFNTGNIIMIIIFALLLLVMILSTTYDVYLYKNEIGSNTLLLAFSVFTNGRKLLKTTVYSKDHVQIFDGMKVISIMWIIAGHGIGSFIGGLLTPMNKEKIDTIHTKIYSGYLDAAHVCVDTFIFISGFLVAYQYFKGKTPSLHTQIKKVPYFYLHRYLRITPAVLMMYLSVLFILPKTGSGPYWHPAIEQELVPCKKYWWSYILYIQNYVNWDELCLVPHWYLSVDLQMYVISPLLLIPVSLMLKKSNGFTYSMVMLLILNVAFIIQPIIQWIVFPEFKNSMATHLRLTDFYIGFMMGVYMRQKKDQPFLSIVKKKYHSRVNLIVWFLVLVEMFTVLFFYQDAEVNQGPIQRAFYFGLSRPAWCIGLCWIIYSSYHGYGGFVHWFLTRSIFQIGAKLSYCMYVVHFTVIAHYTLSNRMKWYFSDYIEFYLWCGYFVETLLWATFWTLAFESPIITIEKYVFGREKPKGHHQNGTIENK
ncbi:nose resistant to fluoxetine protein 6 isoform X2 [Leptinotarsa decemlineata]|uniref:nose resistant to fluoxetine protein 6 isoform X2 n=1 Tax=Leptinotarsa decemlineata TaxID=7539 RepID=UPI003D307BA2